MPYKINRILDKSEFDRHHTKERHYIEMLRRKNLLLEIDNILIDAEQLILRSFQCDTDYCVKCTGSSNDKEYKGSCCTDLQVDVTTDEKSKLIELAQKAHQGLDLESNPQVKKIVDDILADEFTEVNEDHEEEFLHKENGSCALAWFTPEGTLRCTINTLAMELGVKLEEYKPAPCFLFPLHYSEFDVDRILVTMLTEETREWVGQHQSVGRLKCLKKPQPGSPPAYVFLKSELEYVFGKKFYRELDRVAAPVLKRYQARLKRNAAASNGRGQTKSKAKK